MTTNNSVNVGLSGATGTGNFVGSTSPTLVTPALGTPSSGNLANCTGIPAGSMTGQVPLANGGTNANLTASNGGIFYSTASAGAILSGTATANQLLLSGSSTAPTWSTSTYPATNAINTILYASSANTMAALPTANSGVLVTDSGGVPSISSTLPAFTTSSITFSPTTGGIVGTTTNDNAAAGYVGEFISSTILSNGAVVTLSNNTAANITSISLTAGDWDVWGNVVIHDGTQAGLTQTQGWVSSTSASQPDSAYTPLLNCAGGSGFTDWAAAVPSLRFSLSGTSTIYLSVSATIASGTVTAWGSISARRVR